MDDLECLDARRGNCRGEIKFRMPLSGTGVAYPRCDLHWDKRLELQEGINQRYGGDLPPADFDPGYAGERWNEE